ncbi:MAG: HIT family protein [Patescibacteria group bacterium]
MEQCLFCRIVGGEIPAERVYEDDKAVAFLDIFPRAPGHVVIVPRYHAPLLINLPTSEVPGLFFATQRVAQALDKSLGAPGLTIGINQGRVSGQEVDHLHIHLLPRFENDGGGAIQSVVNNPPRESLSEISQKIKSHINGL